MKTKCINLPKPSLNLILSFISMLFFVACGSYQNSSYYDTDGIYGSSDTKVRKQKTYDDSGIVYQSYFNSLQQENEVFTDIENYNSYDENSNPNTLSGNPGWGGNSQGININYFPNNFGMNWGLGWGMPFNNWGWGMPFNNWGWGMPLGHWNTMNFGWGFGGFGGFWGNGFNNWGWGYPNYGSNFVNYSNGRSYSHNESRRGSNYNNLNPSGNDIGRREIQNSTSNYSNQNLYNRRGTTPTFGRNFNTIQNTNYINNNAGRSRVNSSNNPNLTPNRTNSRNDSNPVRRETPSNNESFSPSRSMNTNSSNSGGNYGGGRSSDGGGRRGGR